MARGLPLGAWPGVVYESVTVTLASGDSVLFLTDGLVEATIEDGEQLGYERLLQFMNEAASDGGGSVISGLFAAAAKGSPDALEDDCTALLLQMTAS